MKKPPLGQHFLRDEQVLAKMVAAIAPQAGETLVEIGPGHGQLTRPLLQAGAHVIAIERDKRLAHELPGRLLTGLLANLQIKVGDAARDLPVPVGPWRLVGNLPYAISSPLLTGLAGVCGLVDVTVMLQHEFAVRLAATPGGRDYGRLSVSMQACFAIERIFSVPATAFAPPPKVESAVVRLCPLATAPLVNDAKMFDEILRLAFAQRRKRLANALARLNLPIAANLANLRAENLSVADFVALANLASAHIRT